MSIRRIRTTLLLGLSAMILRAAPALAADPPTAVSGVIIGGGPPPKVKASFPADGSSVPAGVLVLKIVFDQAMTADGWSYQKAADAAFPNCLGRPRMLADQRTFVLLCTIAPNTAYGVQINAGSGFKNADGRSAVAEVVHFTSTDPGVFYMSDALSQAGLGAADGPVMRWPDPDVGKATLAGRPSN